MFWSLLINYLVVSIIGKTECFSLAASKKASYIVDFIMNGNGGSMPVYTISHSRRLHGKTILLRRSKFRVEVTNKI